MNATQKQQLVDSLAHTVTMQRQTLAALAERLVGDTPLYDLGWSADAIEAAAMVEVYTEVLNELAKGTGAIHMRRHAARFITRSARFPERSTSPMHNLAAQAKVTAWARFLDDTEYLEVV